MNSKGTQQVVCLCNNKEQEVRNLRGSGSSWKYMDGGRAGKWCKFSIHVWNYQKMSPNLKKKSPCLLLLILLPTFLQISECYHCYFVYSTHSLWLESYAFVKNCFFFSFSMMFSDSLHVQLVTVLWPEVE